MQEEMNQDNLIGFAAEIVSAYVSNNTIVAENVPSLIASVHAALLSASKVGQEEPKVELVPAVPVRKSVTPDYIICLEDGKRFRSIKRHLMAHYGMTVEDYKKKWNLPADYPSVAPSYAEQRSNLAKTMGLGQRRKVA